MVGSIGYICQLFCDTLAGKTSALVDVLIGKTGCFLKKHHAQIRAAKPEICTSCFLEKCVGFAVANVRRTIILQTSVSQNGCADFLINLMSANKQGICVYTRRVSYCISDRTLEATFGFTLQHARFPSLLLLEVGRTTAPETPMQIF